MKAFVLIQFLCLCVVSGARGYTQSFEGKQSTIEREADSLKNILNQRDREVKEKFHLLLQLSDIFFRENSDTSYHYARLAMEQAERYSLPLALAESHLQLGRIHYKHGFLSEAVNHLLQAIQHFRSAKDFTGLAESLNQLGVAYYYSKQPGLALQVHQEALKVFTENHYSKGRAETLGHLGHWYEKKGDYELALSQQQEALRIYRELQDEMGEARILENIGSIYEDLAEYPFALRHFSEALALSRKINDQESVLIDLNNVGDVYRKTGEYNQALSYTTQALSLAQELNQKYQIASAYKDLAKTYHLMGDDAKAYAHLDANRNLYEEIYTAESGESIARLQTIYEIDKKNKEIHMLEQDKQMDNLLKGGVAIASFLILIASSLLVSRQRLKIRKNKELHQTQQELLRAELNNTQLQALHLQTELENKKLKEQQLQLELEDKSKELTSHTLLIVQKNKVLEDFKDKLKEASKVDTREKSKHLKQLMSLVDYGCSLEKDWNDFRQSFEQVHQTFFDQLLHLYPELTPSETRLCALLKLNLGSKDIATVLGISQDSLRISRYRLRKKLRLGPKENLYAFIQGI